MAFVMETQAENNAPEYDGKSLQERGAAIIQRIRAAEKRESEWMKDAEAAETAYSGKNSEEGAHPVYDFNILHSNVETIVPAIYNSTPVPDVRPRRVEATGEQPKPPQQQEGQEPDPQQAAQFQQAMQVYQAKQAGDKAAKDYGTMLERAITVQIDDNQLDTEIESEAQDSFMVGRGVVRLRFDIDQTEREKITFEAVSWRDYREGPATRWENVPWVAFRVPMELETIERFADEGMMDAQKLANESGDLGKTVYDGEGAKGETIEVWEVWDKLAGKVCFVRDSDGFILKEEDDPLGLPDFFPMAPPVQPIVLTGKRTPVCPFTIYKKLADELDTITKRIAKIMKGLKVRGLVAGDASSLAKLADADDNEILIEDNLEQLVQTGGIDKAVMWWPVEQAIKVLSQLYQQREQVKASIYEITGISDIVRGASNAGETATAQQIKTQWGSLRIQKMQRLIERQVRDIFAIMSHLISTKFSPETLQMMTGIEITEAIQTLMAQPVQASYRVNVESDSTVSADLTRQKKDMNEFLAGSAQFFATAGPIIQQQPQAAEPLAEIYAATSRMFSLGKQTEDALERFVALAKQAGNQERPDPQAEAQKAEMQMKQAELQGKAALEQAKMELERQRFGLEQQKFAADQQKGDTTLDAKAIDLEMKRIDLEIKGLELSIKQAAAIDSAANRQPEQYSA